MEALASLAAAVAGPGGASASPSASISAASSAAEEAEERAAQGAGGVPRIASLPNLHLTNRRLARCCCARGRANNVGWASCLPAWSR